MLFWLNLKSICGNRETIVYIYIQYKQLTDVNEKRNGDGAWFKENNATTEIAYAPFHSWLIVGNHLEIHNMLGKKFGEWKVCSNENDVKNIALLNIHMWSIAQKL